MMLRRNLTDRRDYGMVQRAGGEPQDDAGINLASLPEENLPRQFGKYTLLRRLAAGGMAEIFLALHRSVAGFEKLIVIKRILPSMNNDQAFIEMLLHEARVAATMSHPNIVQTFDVGQVDGTYFIAMEHIHGEDIRSIVRAMRKKGLTEFPLEHAVAIGLGTCAGLAYAHEKRDLEGNLLHIVHRDISPQNIVCTFSGDVKIVDFGVAKSSSQVGEDTKDGQLKGKVPYMSPEQASGGDVDWRSDIFAVGVLIFELTTGKRLFKGSSEFETLKLICEKEYPRPSQVKPGYPPALERIVMKSLEKKREDRYQSAREMQSDLEAFVREERIPVSQISLTQWMQSLFQDKLEQQKEALQDVKQLADIIALQHSPSMYEGIVTAGGGMSATGASTPLPKRSSVGLWIALAAVVAAGVSGFFYMRKQAAEREAKLIADASSQATARARETKGALDVKCGADEGCSIWINGELQKQVTPAKIEGLPLDSEIKVKLTKEGFEAHRESITLTEQAPLRAVQAVMKTGSVTVVLKIDPPATVWLDNKQLKGVVDKLEGLSAGEEHKLVLQLSGYVPKTITFTAEQGETKVIQERLVKADPNSAAAASTSSPPAAGAGGGGGSGKVRVTSKGGFCNVTINGVGYGSTPVEAVVNAGTARVSCKPEGGGASQSQAVQVKAGEVARAAFKLN
ncbi:serine/threonine-protein kinase [Polyangium sp. 15x6]|uniref:serine/threonine protein kinase n=1 Tax=Polyangium sp. 15x6 TaxID=3042687 RepID=UPI00249A5C92|nr:serine/threonine-protein kinase [Polyangium sp. 15x6]